LSGKVVEQVRDQVQKCAWYWRGRCGCTDGEEGEKLRRERRRNRQCRDDRLVVDFASE
jgi:hypothetical protein